MATVTASRNLHRLAVDLERVPRSGMVAAAKMAKKVARLELASSGRGTVNVWRKRTRTRRSVRLRVVDRVRTSGSTTSMRVQGLPVGPWVWANEGTGAHLVGDYAGTRRARSTGALSRSRRARVPYLAAEGAEHPVRGPLWHPGARGRGVWTRTADRVEQLLPDVFAAELEGVLR